MKLQHKLTVVAFLLFTVGIFYAQDNKALLKDLVAEEGETVDALVLYPKETRRAILEVCMYPEVLIKLERLQERTKSEFQDLMQQYPRETQESLWNLTRYPGVIPMIVVNGPKSRSALESIAESFPEGIHTTIVDAGLQHYAALQEINALDTKASTAFNEILKAYPETTQGAFTQLLGLPEILTLLTDDIDLAILAGDVYRSDPEWVLHYTDSLNLVVAEENAKELNDWKQSLEENPEVAGELQATAEEFAEEYQYDDESYQGDDVYYDDSGYEPEVIVHHVYFAYPYWFSYPYWYDYPRWRPYPYWWDWGFSVAPNNVIVVVNLPSYYFMHWYFFRPYHHYYYPRLSAHFARHYAYHPRPASSITASVTEWHNKNRGVVPETWFRPDQKEVALADHFRDFGKFEMDREKYNRQRPNKQLSQIEYLEKNKERYGNLSAVPMTPGDAKTVQKALPGRDKPVRVDAPDKNVPPGGKNEKIKKQQEQKLPPQKKEQEPVKEPGKAAPAGKTLPDMEKANNYHRNTWEKKRTTQEKVTPKPQQAPAKAPSPAKTAPKKAPEKKTAPKKRNS